MISIHRKVHSEPPAAGLSAWRMAWPRANTSSNAGPSFIEPIKWSNQFGSGPRVFIATCSSRTASSTAVIRSARVASDVNCSPVLTY
jgi:hypothetical protein